MSGFTITKFVNNLAEIKEIIERHQTFSVFHYAEEFNLFEGACKVEYNITYSPRRRRFIIDVVGVYSRQVGIRKRGIYNLYLRGDDFTLYYSNGSVEIRVKIDSVEVVDLFEGVSRIRKRVRQIVEHVLTIFNSLLESL